MWEQIYRLAFPTFQQMADIRADGWAQRSGVDRLVILGSSKTLKIDEKVRRKDRSDILLEYWSDEGNKKPGWIAKDLDCDYIAYAFLPSRRCFLLPFQPLRRAWHDNRARWVGRYFQVRAQNPGYTTVSVAVPILVLMDAIKSALVVNWPAP